MITDYSSQTIMYTLQPYNGPVRNIIKEGELQ